MTVTRDDRGVEKPPAGLTFVVERSDPRSADAAELIRWLTVELAARYDHLDDGTGNFRPQDVLIPGADFLIGRVGGRAVACAAFRPLEPGVAEVKRVFVVPEHRGRGYGRLLMAELERHAAAFGYLRLRLETGDRQPESVALYEGAGFRRIPNYGPYVGSHWSLCFEKRIDGTDGDG